MVTLPYYIYNIILTLERFCMLSFLFVHFGHEKDHNYYSIVYGNTQRFLSRGKS